MRGVTLITLLLVSTLLPASELRTWDLHHRSAAEMIPLLKPMLESNDAISGSGYTLIVRSNKENLAQLDTLIARLDTAPQMLLISIAHGADEQREKSGASLSGSTTDPKLKVYRSYRNSDDAGSQQLKVLEGHWATIRSGQAIPQVMQQTQQGPNGSTVTQSIEYRNVESGFEVRPHLVGDRIQLDIRPFRAKLSSQGGGVIEQQEIVTTVSGRPGEWIDLGGVAEEQNRKGTGIIYSTRKREQQSHNIRIKVEIIQP
jgi:type II secretory pathway component GspD/PulD (secretin)